MLATGTRQAIGDQHQCPLAERDAIAASAPAFLRHHLIKTELVPELTCRQDRPPIPRANGGNALAAYGSISSRIAVQQTAELVEIKMPCQQIPATEIDDRVVTGLAVGIAIGLDHADVFAFDAFADGRSDQAQKHDPIAGTSAETCPCNSYAMISRFAIIMKKISDISCPYKSANARHSPKQLQSLASVTSLRSVKHALGSYKEFQAGGTPQRFVGLLDETDFMEQNSSTEITVEFDRPRLDGREHGATIKQLGTLLHWF